MASRITRPLDDIDHDCDPLLIGLEIGNAIWQAVYGTPVPDLVIPEPLACSPCLHPKDSKETVQ